MAASLVVVALSLTLGALAFLGVLTWSPAPNALAGGAVGTGSPASCTQAALDTALAGGGLVTFNCGADPVTITVTGTKVISPATTIDGGGKIILSGGNITGVLRVPVSSTLTLQNITITAGSGVQGGAIKSDGALVLSRTAIVSNTASQGGGVYSTGPLTVTDSQFTANSALTISYSGGALYQELTPAEIRRSTFSNNNSPGYGGAIQTLVTTTIVDSAFLSNTTTVTGSGSAAIEVDGGLTATLTVDNSRFIGNRALGIAGGGDAAGINFYGLGDLTVRNSLFSSGFVSTTGSAGGVRTSVTPRSVLISGSTFSNNAAGTSGAGAAALRAAGYITVENSTFTGNTVISNGSGALLAFPSFPYTMTAVNNTFSGNNGGIDGAGAFLNTSFGSGAITLTHNTIVSNTTAGAGFGISVTEGSTITLASNIIANNTGANCSGSGAYIFLGFNIQDGDNSCPSVARTDPRLATLANNGGPVWTHGLLTGSGALDNAPATYCPPTDARGALRPQLAGCDVGAFEKTLPTLTAISPVTGTASGVTITVELTGTNFVPGASALVDGAPRATAYLSATRISATLTATDTASARTITIAATNPGPGEGPTAGLPLTLTGHIYVPIALATYQGAW